MEKTRFNWIDESDLDSMISKFNHTSYNDIALTEIESMKIFNWMQELKMYRQLAGPLSSCKRGDGL